MEERNLAASGSNQFWVASLMLGFLMLGLAAPAIAQITPDDSLGAESSVVVPTSSTDSVILNGAERGTTLFHSFEVFNV